MTLLKLEPFPEFSRTLEKNKWADYLELLCLENSDKEISLSDIVSIYVQYDLPGVSNGDEDYSEKTDTIRANFLEIFKLIFSRINYINDFYPFIKVDETTIKMSEIDEKKILYFFLLFSSNTAYIKDSHLPSFLRTSFERISIDIMRLLYPTFKNELFGTSTRNNDFFYGGLLIKKLEKLGICLNTSLTDEAKRNPRFQNTSGDAGLDLVSFYMIEKNDCAVPMLPVCLGQCSSSYIDWKNKQHTITTSYLRNLFIRIANCHEYTFVSFPLRGIDGKWAYEEATSIQTIIIDRIRFFNILSHNNKNTVLDNEMSNQIKQILGNYNVSI
jgi:hypothetical protein